MNYIQELLSCQQDFTYFCKYVKIPHAFTGVISFDCWPYQKNLIKHCEENQFTIFVKFRQGGFTTVMAIYALWKTLFNEQQQIDFISRTNKEAYRIGEYIKKMLPFMPKWMTAMIASVNKEEITFHNGSDICFSSSLRGKLPTHVIFDEVAFIPNMANKWTAAYPCFAQGTKAIVLSTTNGIDNWFFDVYQDAQDGRNRFAIFETNYLDCPAYKKKDIIELKKNLGDYTWAQEIEGKFVIKD